MARPDCPETWQPASTRTCCDDLLYADLAATLQKNIQALQKTAETALQVCQQTIATQSIINGYGDLQNYISHHSPREISHYIDENFNFCSPAQVLITGYYEPVVQASLIKTDGFKTPLYTIPPGKIAPKFKVSRAAIETTQILHGHEIVYVADLFTAFTIHVQGSALLTFNDGTERQVHYQNSNGKPYTSVGRILIQQGSIKREDMSMLAIRTYINNHPLEAAALLQTNERFIYFTLSQPVINPVAPSGSFNIPLTPHRSIALDPTMYPQGLLFHLQGTLPTVSPSMPDDKPFHRRAFSRFVLNQDSGSAIKGRQRVDMFMGRGEVAEGIASEMQENGCLRVLLPK